MDVVCLLVDVDQEDLVDQWEDLTASVEFPMPIKYVAPDEVEPMISAGGVVMMVMFSMVGAEPEAIIPAGSIFCLMTPPLSVRRDLWRSSTSRGDADWEGRPILDFVLP